MNSLENFPDILWKRWTWMRGLRLVAGAWFLLYGILQGDWVFGIAGGYFFIQGLFNLGCRACGNNGCQLDPRDPGQDA